MSAPVEMETFDEDGFGSFSGTAEFKLVVVVVVVGDADGVSVGLEVGPEVGPDVGLEVLGTELGAREGISDGTSLGVHVGELDGFVVGVKDGVAVGTLVTRMLFFALLILTGGLVFELLVLAEEICLELLMMLGAGVLERGSLLDFLIDLLLLLALLLDAFFVFRRAVTAPSSAVLSAAGACRACVGSVEANEGAAKRERVTKVKKRAKFFFVRVIIL
jgi:hypothetical protein